MGSKQIIRQTLDFWAYQLDHNLCTAEQLETLSKRMQEDLCDLGTVEDFARFTGKPEQYVRNVINRKVTDKPKRRVYYRFQSFLKNIPDKWLWHK